jgi:hypothetical protein
MSQKIQQMNMAVLLQNNADDLLQAHQGLIDAWFDAWTTEQRARAQELLRKRYQASNQPDMRERA